MVAAGLMLAGCYGDLTNLTGQEALSRRETPLTALKSDVLTIERPATGRSTAASQPASTPAHTFRVWLALTGAERTEGLMFVPEDAIADDQGMLFAFTEERILGFWMRNTITSLDIAFARSDGTIVAIHTMPPLTLNTFSSFEPAMYALEVKAGTFAKLDIREGDRLVVPDMVFNARP